MSATARSAAAPVPLIPRFSWSPKYADFPLPFPGSDAAARPADVRPALPAYDGEAAPVLDWQKFGAAALLIAA
ncbi:MAG: hypothetical protein ACRD1H_08655, partial [Vicinamibacterales bacterium]